MEGTFERACEEIMYSDKPKIYEDLITLSSLCLHHFFVKSINILFWHPIPKRTDNFHMSENETSLWLMGDGGGSASAVALW